jgi:uncharacterized SAM-binding protein YcdF (DUF218 family)
LGLSLWAFFTKNQVRRRRLILVAVLVLFVSGNKVLVNELARAWEMEPVAANQRLPKTAIVLGGYAEWDQFRNRVQMSDAADRIYSAINLYQQGKIHTIVLSGGAASLTGRIKAEADYVLPVLRGFGIPDSAIIKESKSRNTFENAINTAALLHSLKRNDTILLITSAFHMRRAVGAFKKAGIAVVPYPVHYISDYGRGYFLPDFFIPSTEAMFRFDALLKEWIGYFAYSVSGKR